MKETIPFSQQELDFNLERLSAQLSNSLEFSNPEDRSFFRFVRPQEVAVALESANINDDPDEFQMRIASARRFVKNLAGVYGPQRLTSIGLSADSFEFRYLDMIGSGDLQRGKIARAARRTLESVPEDRRNGLIDIMAKYVGTMLVLDPHLLASQPYSSIQIDSNSNSVIFTDTKSSIPIERPIRNVMDLGSGLTGVHRFESDRDKDIDHLTLVEPNRFESVIVGTVLKERGYKEAKDYEIQQGKMSEVLNTKLMSGLPEEDLIIMSMVHSAGLDELTRGISGSAGLLREGGAFVLRSVDEVKSGEASRQDIVPYAIDFFGQPDFAEPFKYRQQTTGSIRHGMNFVFIKR